jgi:hypothetical protein
VLWYIVVELRMIALRGAGRVQHPTYMRSAEAPVALPVSLQCLYTVRLVWPSAEALEPFSLPTEDQYSDNEVNPGSSKMEKILDLG